MTAIRTSLIDIPARIAQEVARMAHRLRVSFVPDWSFGIWLVIWNDDIQGVLRNDGSRWCLEWLEGADPRLASYAGVRPGASLDDVTDDLVRHLAGAALAGSAPAASLRVESIPVF